MKKFQSILKANGDVIYNQYEATLFIGRKTFGKFQFNCPPDDDVIREQAEELAYDYIHDNHLPEQEYKLKLKIIEMDVL